MLKCPFESVIKAAGDLMLSIEKPRVTEKEGHANFVTEGDVAVQRFLVEKLSALYPQAAFMAEEEEEHHIGSGLTFIIDPIDGTTNYMRRRRSSVISVGAVENGKPVLGAIYHPYTDELYYAEAGKGAWCNGESIHVSDFPIEKGLIMLGTAPYNQELVNLTARSVGALLHACGDLRRSGSVCVDLCDVAAGRAEGLFEWVSQPWDYCAGTLLVQEAGGKVGQILSDDMQFLHSAPLMAATDSGFDYLRKVLKDVYQNQA